ncbi:hypothetical protein HAX54_044828 [Datura stramonium]|uniref:Uncharacterized protein n=1 Tax=Datura stramonium TaxID=4076 RepID=A0ABS8WIV2_DATST|nr:hypothetical protein [Datura stramonium]
MDEWAKCTYVMAPHVGRNQHTTEHGGSKVLSKPWCAQWHQGITPVWQDSAMKTWHLMIQDNAWTLRLARLRQQGMGIDA